MYLEQKDVKKSNIGPGAYYCNFLFSVAKLNLFEYDNISIAQ